MQLRWLMLLAAAVFVAGCAEDSEPLEPETSAPSANETVDDPVSKAMGPQEVPNQSFQVSDSWTGAVDVQNIGTLAPCSAPTSDCHFYPFTTTEFLDLSATLSWALPVNDLDLYLWDMAGNELSQDGINNIGDVPTTEQVLRFPSLPPGEYQLVVVPWSAVNASYTLDAELS